MTNFCKMGANELDAPTIRVVVADDHPVVRKAIMHELSYHAEFQVVCDAATSDDALAMARTRDPDVLVLDITMPGPPVSQILGEIAMLPAPPRVLILTAHTDLDHILSMLKAGATGYMLKDEDPSAIPAAVRAVAQGQTWMSAAVAAKVVNHTVREPVTAGEAILSERERQVLEQLAEGKDNNEIGAVLNISERTVRFHLRNIYDKLGVRRGEAIARAVRMGMGTLSA